MWIHYSIKKRNILHQIYEWNLQDSMVGKELIGMLTDLDFFTSRPEGPVTATTHSTSGTGVAAGGLAESNMKVNPSTTSILSTIASAATAAMDTLVGDEEEEQEGEEFDDEGEGGV